jgi:hypothetical protein
MTTPTAEIAEQLRRRFLHQPFGIVQFWGMGMIPANDQAYELVSIHVEGNRLDLVFVHASHSGLPGTLSIWDPDGLEAALAGLGQGIAIRDAQRLVMGDSEATSEGAQFRARTSRGEGVLPKDGAPALVLAR